MNDGKNVFAKNASMQEAQKFNVCDSVGVTSAQRQRYVCPVADVDADVPSPGKP
jgi:hypothetical protein